MSAPVVTRRLFVGGGLAATAVALVPALAAAKAPTVTTGTATSITSTGATLNGTVKPGNKPTTAYFEYGLTTAYGQRVPAADINVGNGNATVPVSAPVAGLTPGVLYHFRLRATNADGARFGADATFTTTGGSSGGDAYSDTYADTY